MGSFVKMLDKICSTLLCFLAVNLIQKSSEQILLRSLLPLNPIQEPEDWAWGKLSNGNVFIADQSLGGEISSASSEASSAVMEDRAIKELEDKQLGKEGRTEIFMKKITEVE